MSRYGQNVFRESNKDDHELLRLWENNLRAARQLRGWRPEEAARPVAGERWAVAIGLACIIGYMLLAFVFRG